MADKKLRVGIIGTGGIAHAHMDQYTKMDDVEIVAGADLIEGKAEAFFETWKVEGVKCYPSHKELLDDESLHLDAVSVCTNHTAHAECTIYALQKGINVLLEKPMCVTSEEAIEICRAEKASGKILSIGFQPRLDENMQMIKKIVESGKLGKIYYIQTGGGRRRTYFTSPTFITKKDSTIGAVGDIGCYALDMVLNAIGYPKPLTVSGHASAHLATRPDYYTDPEQAKYAEMFEVDDFAAAFIRLEGDIILDFRISWAMNMDTTGDTIILGTEGGLKIPSTDCWNGTPGGPLVLYQHACGQPVQMEFPIIPSNENCFFKKVRSFLDAIKNGGTAPIPSSQILYNQIIIDGIMKSSKLGEEIKIEIPEI